MTASQDHRAAEIRGNLSHPIVDGDGHVIEPRALLYEYVGNIAGPDVLKRFLSPRSMAPTSKPIFWAMPSASHSIDRATAMMPRLFKDRLDEAGIDVGIVYSTGVLTTMHIRDDEIRQAAHRALNTLLADMFRGTEDRLIPSAAIPMYTPEEAINELDYVVNELGFKACTFGTEVRKAIPEIEKAAPELAHYTEQIFSVALDSLHDYDPVWQKCADLKIAVAGHTAARGGGTRRSSPSNFVFNHLGGFAQGGDYFARCLFFGGVTRRFPELNFAFLEGGVGWACQLYNDIFEHWEKRNVDYLKTNMNPEDLDLELMYRMADQYGGGLITHDAILKHQQGGMMGGIQRPIPELDEFKHCKIEKKEDIRDLFAEPFYFGCEGDDAMNAIAFDSRLHHYGVKLKAMFGSDIGHWDVEDIRHCVPDAYRNVEKGLFSDEDFQDFMFTNPVKFFTKQNPEFFVGTTIEDKVERLLAETV